MQSSNLRAALFRCFSGLKKDGVLGRDIYLRKSTFEDCKADTTLKIMLSFSNAVLLKVLASHAASGSSIVGQLLQAENVPPADPTLLMPLAIAHRKSLSSRLSRRRVLRARYRDLSNALENKDQDLAQKFEKIVETQEFLDQNPPSESTVDRVSRVLDQQWQGNRVILEVIAQGEEQEMSDVLLDDGFEAVWHKAGTGEFDGDISTSQNGLLQDLEKRVTDQRARVEYWKDFKNDISAGTNHQITSPSLGKQPKTSPKSLRYEQRKEKELVFSPRKSPRKSMWPEFSSVDPTATEERVIEARNQPEFAAMVSSSPLAAKSSKVIESVSAGLLIHNASEKDHDDSSFSELSANELHRTQAQLSSKSPRSSDHTGFNYEVPTTPLADTQKISSSTRSGVSVSSDVIRASEDLIHKSESPSTKTNEDEQLAEKLVSIALDTALTPEHLALPLIERTRQTMAFARPDQYLLHKSPPPLDSHPTRQREMSPVIPLTAANLAERTRQSISLVPARAKRSRDSTHVRRTSKNFPTNQFETPRKQSGVQRLTPPEELMSPRAGYDSVFKSRPKVALSPVASPEPESGSSPLADFSDQVVASLDHREDIPLIKSSS